MIGVKGEDMVAPVWFACIKVVLCPPLYCTCVTRGAASLFHRCCATARAALYHCAAHRSRDSLRAVLHGYACNCTQCTIVCKRAVARTLTPTKIHARSVTVTATTVPQCSRVCTRNYMHPLLHTAFRMRVASYQRLAVA